VFDTGTSLAYVPYTISADLISKILRGKKYANYFGTYITTCDTSQFESVYIYFNGYWMEIPPSTYIVIMGDDGNGNNICGLGFVPNSSDYWLLGDVFLRNYFVVFDQGNDKIGFAPHIYSAVQSITTGSLPSDKFSSIDTKTMAGVGTAVTVLLALIAVPLICIIGCAAQYIL